MKRTGVIIGLLLVSLIFNYLMLNRLGNLETKISFLQSNLHNLENSTQQSVNRINQTMTQFEEEQRWITPLEVNAGEKKGDKREVELSWLVKDFKEGANVTFYYKLGTQTDFTSIKATPSGGGHFKVNLPIQLETEPKWRVHWEYVGEVEAGTRSSRVVEEAKDNDDFGLRYYVSVQEGDRLRSSEKEWINIGQVAKSKYPPLTVDISANLKTMGHNINLIQHGSSSTSLKIDKAVLEVYNGKNLVTQKLLGDRSEHDRSVGLYNTNWNPQKDQDFDRLVLKVTYEDGKEFTKDITGTYH